jgi:hypothetical protein
MYNYRTIVMAESQPADTNYTSPAYDIKGFESFGLEMGITGFNFNDATLAVQVSISGSIWEPLDNGTAVIDAACAGLLMTFHPMPWAKVRFVFTANSNTAGSFTILLGGKVLLDNGIPGNGVSIV